MKTIKQIADELGISKQKLYRYIKSNHIIDSHQTTSLIHLNEQQERLLIKYFKQKITSSEAHRTTSNDMINDTLIKQLEEKDNQIKKLQQLLDQQQQLQLNTQKQLEQLQIEYKEEKKEKSFLKKIFNMK